MPKRIRSRKIAQEKAYRRRRSFLKKRLRLKAVLSRRITRRYNLNLAKHSQLNLWFNFNDLKKSKFDELVPKHTIKIPRVLCFIRDPDNTLNFLCNLENDLKGNGSRNIFIDHANTETLGLAASQVFDDIIEKHHREISAQHLRFRLSGQTSRHKQVNNFLLAIGFLKKISLSHEKIAAGVDWDYLHKFQSFGISGNKNHNHLKSAAATGLTKYFNECLKYKNLCLSDDGATKLTDAFGEIIANAEEHNTEVATWTAQGCYEKETGYANFAIINDGLSIYQTLSSNESTAKDILNNIRQTIDSHRGVVTKTTDFLSGGIQFNEFWDHTIWNVMALQEGVSSKRFDEIGDQRTRGQGLVDFLEFISEVSETSSDFSIAILSGYSYIFIDFKKYKLKRVKVKEEERRRICFNEDCDLEMPQDRKYVYPLSKEFKGTIITGRFKLNTAVTEPKRD